MKRKILHVALLLVLSATMFSSCMSQEEKTQRAKVEIKEDMTEKYRENGYTVQGFDLFHKEGDEYGGSIKVYKDGMTYTYKIKATWDSSSFNWETY